MSKPILAALGAFTGSSLAVLGVSYLKHEEFAYMYALSLGVAMGIAMYAFAHWRQQNDESQPQPNDPSADEEQLLDESQPEDNDYEQAPRNRT